MAHKSFNTHEPQRVWRPHKAGIAKKHREAIRKLSAATLIVQTFMSILLVLGMHGAVIAASPTPNPKNSPADLKILDDAMKQAVENPPAPVPECNELSTTGCKPKADAPKSKPTPTKPCGTGPTQSGSPCDSEKFNVSQYLNANDQEQSYLKSGNPIGSFIIQVINFLVLTIGSVCLVALVIGGFILMVSHGNENALTKGKDIIKDALIGLVVVLCSYMITAFVQNLLYDLPK